MKTHTSSNKSILFLLDFSLTSLKTPKSVQPAIEFIFLITFFCLFKPIEPGHNESCQYETVAKDVIPQDVKFSDASTSV